MSSSKGIGYEHKSGFLILQFFCENIGIILWRGEVGQKGLCRNTTYIDAGSMLLCAASTENPIRLLGYVSSTC